MSKQKKPLQLPAKVWALAQEIKQEVLRLRLLKPGDCVLAAVSGGADSVALLFFLKILAAEIGFQIVVGHVNHGLRGAESDRDQDFVESLAKDFGLPCVVRRAEGKKSFSKGDSLEQSARRWRHRMLVEMAQETKSEVIALGHTLDDQAETVLMRLLRGTGPQGLQGILPLRKMRGKIWIRPLLNVRRAQIESCLKSLNLAWREDSTNQSEVFLRNRVRHHLLPFLEKEYQPKIKTLLSQLAETQRVERQFIEKYAESLWPLVVAEPDPLVTEGEGWKVALKLREIQKHPAAVQRQLWRMAIEQVCGSAKRMTYLHWRALEDLAEGRKRSVKVELPRGWEARRQSTMIYIRRLDMLQS